MKESLWRVSLFSLKKTMSERMSMAIAFQHLYRNTERLALIGRNYKISIHDERDMELFNIATDPGEENNLANEKPDKLNEMRNQLEKIKLSWQKSREGNDYQW
jgi:hypothetical protein